MRHTPILRSLTTCGLAIFLVVMMQQGVMAQWGKATVTSSAPHQTESPAYTRFITIMVDTGPMLTPNLTSLYQSQWLSVPLNLTTTFTLILPDDSTDIEANVINGAYTQTGRVITLTLNAGITTFGWQYRTAQNITRQGKQYRVTQRASDNLFPFQYQGVLSFSAPYQYVGTLEYMPTTQSITQARWDLPSDYIPEIYTAPHRLLLTTWLADPRITERPDLEVLSHSLQVETQSAQSVAHIVASVRNRGTYTTGAPAYLNLYDRLTPAAAPVGPLDLEGGWCGTPSRLSCYSTTTFTNPLNIVGPNQTVSLAADYVFTRTGRHQFYLLIDAFGSEVGLNLESNETNNLVWLGEALRPFKVFLPMTRK